MVAMLTVFGLVVFAYLLGSVPSGWIVMKLYRGQDLRRVGSGNIGAANVFRAGGPGAFATTLAADGLKGVIPVLAGILLGYGPQEWVLALIGLAAVVGHSLPVFLGCHGGKGVGTAPTSPAWRAVGSSRSRRRPRSPDPPSGRSRLGCGAR